MSERISGRMNLGQSLVQRALCIAMAMVAALCLGAARGVSAQCMYEIEAIVVPPNCTPTDPFTIVPNAINDNGVVCGYVVGCSFTDERPFTWSEETGLVILELPEGVTDARAEDINNHGDIVGTMNVFAQSADQAFVIKDGVWTKLPPLDGLPQARAHAINDDGVVVGESLDIITGPTLACVWQGGNVVQIELPIGPNSSALDINASDVTTGWTGRSGTRPIAFLATARNAIAIPELRNPSRSEGLAINSPSTVTGQTLISAKSARRSWVYEGKILIDLGAFPENSRTVAKDMNDAEQIVGESNAESNANRLPFLWQDGKLIDLRTLVVNIPPDIFLRQAAAINNRGVIVATANGTDRFAVLSPTSHTLGDINFDCVVDERDLTLILGHWGRNSSSAGDIADIVTSADFQPPGDGQVDGADLAVVLGNWSVSSAEVQSPTKRR